MEGCKEKLIINGVEICYCVDSKGHEGKCQCHYKGKDGYIKTIWYEKEK